MYTGILTLHPALCLCALLGSVTPTGFGFDKQSAKAVLVLLYGKKAVIFILLLFSHGKKEKPFVYVFSLTAHASPNHLKWQPD